MSRQDQEVRPLPRRWRLRLPAPTARARRSLLLPPPRERTSGRTRPSARREAPRRSRRR
ncbi:unnamed protein product [Spirodela intermedia]|uniref:Uncharacterized protein n=1 Tax=Spirodela intermedia TaxID=51605 RepID=A0A7I8LLW6_SPIIN|nr:unnamed protein product [Spirodela intermedia]